MTRETVANELYRRLGNHARFKLADLRGQTLPQNGVYFFFEDGEYRSDQATPRVVRVGTHGVRPPRNPNRKPRTLRHRISEHFGNMAGGGSHRASIFRSLIGRALPEAPLSWGIPKRAAAAHAAGVEETHLRAFETTHENLVSEAVRRMSVVCIPADGMAARKEMERGAISLLSNAVENFDQASEQWLGRACQGRAAVITSGLWNQDMVDDAWDENPDAEEAFLRLVPEHPH